MGEVIKLHGIRLPDLERIGESLRGGGLACLPTETVYGLAGMAAAASVAPSIYDLKGRDPQKPLVLVFQAVQQVIDTLPSLPGPVRQVLVNLLPGSVTAVLPAAANETAELGLTGATSIGVRVIPPPLEKLYRQLPGPLLLTSANISGEPDPRLAEHIPSSILEACAFVIDAGTQLPGVASTVIDLRPVASGSKPEILREGAVPGAELLRKAEGCGCF